MPDLYDESVKEEISQFDIEIDEARACYKKDVIPTLQHISLLEEELILVKSTESLVKGCETLDFAFDFGTKSKALVGTIIPSAINDTTILNFESLSEQSKNNARGVLIETYPHYLRLLIGGDVYNGKGKLEARELTLVDAILGEIYRYQRVIKGFPAINSDDVNIAVCGILQAYVTYNQSRAEINTSKAKDTMLNVDQLEEMKVYHRRQFKDVLPVQYLIEQSLSVEKAKLELLRINPFVENFMLENWIRNNAREWRAGNRDVFMTDYYRNIIDYALELGDKKNGIGGRLYYGPPGTGKTQIAIEVNKIQGYKTRVVPVHYWSSFTQLFGEPVIQIAGIQMGERGGDQHNRLLQIADYYLNLINQGQSGAEEFTRILEAIATNTGTSIDALRSNLSKDGAYTSDRDLLMAIHIDMRAKMTMSHIGSLKLDEGIDDAKTWINGEILDAVAQGERVVLDEVDKGGDHSLTSLSYLLSARPGTNIKFRDNEVHIPSWFRIDATANLLSLGGPQEYFYDRFSQINVDYPPLSDELLILGVWLSDSDGRIRISPDRLESIVCIYKYYIEEIRRLYSKGQLSQPFSLRASKEFCHAIVNPITGVDRGFNIYDVLNSVLFGSKGIAATKEQKIALRNLLHGIDVWTEKPAIIDLDDDLILDAPQTNRTEVVTRAKREIAYSPLLNQSVETKKGVRRSHRPRVLPFRFDKPINAPNPTDYQSGFPEIEIREGNPVLHIVEGYLTDSRSLIWGNHIVRSFNLGESYKGYEIVSSVDNLIHIRREHGDNLFEEVLEIDIVKGKVVSLEKLEVENKDKASTNIVLIPKSARGLYGYVISTQNERGILSTNIKMTHLGATVNSALREIRSDGQIVSLEINNSGEFIIFRYVNDSVVVDTDILYKTRDINMAIVTRVKGTNIRFYGDRVITNHEPDNKVVKGLLIE